MLHFREKDIELLWDRTLQIRFGGEYLLKENIPLKGGYYYDDSPTLGIRLNPLLPSVTHHGITIGAGYRAGNIKYDFGLECLIGSKQKINPPSPDPGIHKSYILAPNFSVAYRF